PKKLRRRLRRLARATGPGRDTEVQIEWLRPRGQHLAGTHRASLAWILAHLDGRMRKAYAKLGGRLEDEFPALERGLRQHLSVYRTEVHLDPQAPRPTFGEATAAVLRAQTVDLERHLARIEDEDDETEAHQARISAKRVRYLLEPLLDELPPAAPLVKRLKGLQDLLGELHDAHVLETELHDATLRAATERAEKLFALSLAETPDPKILRAERRRTVESGLIALARLNRARRDRLFEKLEDEWLDGARTDFFAELAQAAEALLEHPLPPPLP
ncbi:MAG TPA: CHAD domain-containing protein, partial [Thermoanaerobaculia bacterium]|nr:CHAD domain-containing protein [Thermoanaerobaculia bacterium]